MNWASAMAWIMKPTGRPPQDLWNFVQRRVKVKPVRPKIKLTREQKAKTPQAQKKSLKAQLEACCKAIVFTRDCGHPDLREGNCISCREYRTLQWGHFIRQQDSKWLQYDPRNTGGQCRKCNMEGGNVLAYAREIDIRDGAGKSEALQAEAKANENWRPTKANLQAKLFVLHAILRGKGIPIPVVKP